MLQVYKERSRTIKMDLNEIPPEFYYDFLDCSDANPSYCTQAVEAIALGGEHDIAQVTGHQVLINVEATVDNCNLAEKPEDVQTIADSTTGVVDVEEVWSTPPIPYTGQIFSSKLEARKFYN